MLLTVSESLNIVLINLVTSFIMSEKIATPDFSKIKVLWNKGWDVINYVRGVSTKFYHVAQIILLMLSCNQSLVNLAFLWKKLS